MFKSRAEMHEVNLRQARNMRTEPATLTGPDGPKPGVVIFEGYRVKAVLPIDQALRLANEIADAVEAHDTRSPREVTQ